MSGIEPSCREAGDENMRQVCVSHKRNPNFVRLRINHLVSPEPHLQLSTQQVPSLNPIQTSHLNRPPQSSIAVKDTSITSPSVVARDERSQSLRPLTIHRICERRLS